MNHFHDPKSNIYRLHVQNVESLQHNKFNG